MKSNSAVVNTAVNLVGAITPLFVSILYIPAAIGAMGAERYGLYSLLAAVLAYFGFFEFGIGRATARFMLDAATHWTDAQIAFHGVALTALFGVAGAVLISLLSPWIARFAGTPGADLHGDFLLGIFLVACMLPLMLLESIFRCLLEAMNDFMIVNVLKILSALLTALAVITLARHEVSSIAPYMVATGSVRLLSVLVHGVLWRLRSGIVLEWKWQRGIIGGLMAFGGWSSVSTILGPLMVNFDRFWISYKFTNVDVAYYTVPFDAITKLWLIPGAIVGVIFPLLVRTGFTGADAEKSGRLVLQAFAMSGLVVLPGIVLATFFASPLMSWWVDPVFAQASAPLLAILALGVLVNVPAQVLFTSLYAAGRPDVPAKFHLVEIPVYLLLMFCLSHWFGLVGVAVAWLLRVMLDSLLLAWAFQQLVSVKAGLLRAMWGVIAVVAALAALLCLPGGIWRNAIGGILFLCSAVLVLWLVYTTWKARRS